MKLEDSSQDSGKLRPSGGYRTLRSFQVTTIIYDATVQFCEHFLDGRSRTVDQMVQAARSGRQNIAEGSRASATSSQTELRLVNVARASLDELLLDYEDYLRQRGKLIWDKSSPQARAVREVASQNPTSAPTSASYAVWLASKDPVNVANCLICLIHQANYLLDQQIRSLEKTFIEEGGYSEALAAKRMAYRSSQKNTSQESKAPNCQICGAPMSLRTARKGPQPNTQFWGCTTFPKCKGSQKI